MNNENANLDKEISTLIGREVMVLPPNSIEPMNYDENRVKIYTDFNRIIEDIKFG